MPFFKYYRPNFYFEKAIRYDEIYFSSNDELNDPLDLIVKPYFEDNKDAWEKLLQEAKPTIKNWDLRFYLDTSCKELASDLNNIFKDVSISNKKTIKESMASKEEALESVFIKHINKTEESGFKTVEPPLFSNSDIKSKSKICVLILCEILSRGWSRHYYSSSFSKAALEPMMWAHYADGFKGCVIIYDVDVNNSISLKSHPSSNKYNNYNFSEVKYVDTEKKICILEHLLGSDGINSALLAKSSFWSYEEEFRLLLSEDFGSVRMALQNDMPTSSKNRIFHHDPCSIIGVIFGARCSSNYKEYIEGILGEKYSYIQPLKRFLSLETELTFDGRVVISY